MGWVFSVPVFSFSGCPFTAFFGDCCFQFRLCFPLPCNFFACVVAFAAAAGGVVVVKEEERREEEEAVPRTTDSEMSR